MSTASSVPSVTLQTAVLEQVKYFASVSRTFSIHDVTTAIRRNVAQGELEIPETEVAGSSFRNDIPHSKVKEIFNDLFSTGVFDPYCTFNRKFNGTYFEYTPIQVACTQPVTQPVTPAVTVTANVGNAAPVTVTTTPNVSVSQIADADVKSRISIYLNNCRIRNFRPTLKQVQSAIKRSASTGWTCTKIGDYIEQELGYTIVSDPDFVSASQVAVV